MIELKEALSLCTQWGVKHLKTGDFEVEFFEQKKEPEPMPLDPVNLSKILSDSMPPDSIMQFAATEEIPDPVNPKSEQGE